MGAMIVHTRRGQGSQITIEFIHDVVFFPFAQIQLGYLLGDAAGSELFVTEVRIT